MTPAHPITAIELQTLLALARAGGKGAQAPLDQGIVNYLATQARGGDQEAREMVCLWGTRLIAPHLRRVQWMRFSDVGPEDMWQEGRLMLMRAIERYDAEKGYDFGAYAARIIANHLRNWLEEHVSVMRVPRAARKRLYQEGAVDDLTRRARQAISVPRYLSQLGRDDDDEDDDGFGELGADTQNVEDEAGVRELRGRLADALLALDPLHFRVIHHRHVEGRALDATSRLMCIGVPKLRDLEAEAVAHLARLLADYR